MPYVRRRKVYRRKNYRKKGARPWYMRRYNAMELAGKAFQGVKYIKSMINAEKKKFDTGPTTVALSSAGASSDYFSSITAGDDVGNRNGNSILAKGIKFRATLTAHASAVTSYARIIILQDTEFTGSPPGITDILTGMNMTSNLNVDTTGRFNILHDKIYQIGAIWPQRCIDHYMKLNNHIKYTGVNAGDRYKNQILMYAFSDQATNTPSLTYSARLYFYDN